MTETGATQGSGARVGVSSTLTSGVERTFPTLTLEQVERIAVHGRVRQIRPGEVLVQPGDQIVPFFVVTARYSNETPIGNSPEPASLQGFDPECV